MKQQEPENGNFEQLVAQLHQRQSQSLPSPQRPHRRLSSDLSSAQIPSVQNKADHTTAYFEKKPRPNLLWRIVIKIKNIIVGTFLVIIGLLFIILIKGGGIYILVNKLFN